MVCQYLQDLHVLGDLLPTFDLLVEIFLTQTFDRREVSAKLMLCYAYLSKGTFAELVPYAVELRRGRNWLAHFLEVCDNHGDQVLFVFKKWVEHLSNLDLGLVAI